MVTERDREWMARAAFWAERGRGRTSPNPIVGAVVVSPDDVVVGQAAHLKAGDSHAEVLALEAAGDRAKGATLYCTLEPCAHEGRTGPCCVRVADAGVARVVIACADPNPKVSGRGVEYLRSRGVEVVEGVGEDLVRGQLAPFFTWVTSARPFVILKSVASLDGFVGRATERVILTGEAANRFFQRQRAEVDAIAVGSGTLLVDDPWLTPRGAYRRRPLTRVVFDWRGRMTASARVCSTLEAGPVIMVVSEEAVAAKPDQFAALRAAGVDVWPSRARELRGVMTRLAARDIVTLLVEGGPTLHGAFAEAGLVDRVQWVVVPRTLGDGVPVVSLVSRGVDTTRAARTRPLGSDLLMEFDVHGTDRINGTH